MNGGQEEWENGRKGVRINSHKDLKVWEESMNLAMDIFKLTKNYPQEEKYSIVDQMRRSSRSVTANIAEAWRKRRYKAAFISKLSDAESEACETQTWLEFSMRCGYLTKKNGEHLDGRYEILIRQIITMIHNYKNWVIPPSPIPPLSRSN